MLRSESPALIRSPGSVGRTLARLCTKVLERKVLVAYLGFGLALSVIDGSGPRAVVNYILLALYVAFIHRWTRARPEGQIIRREAPGRELAQLIAFFALYVGYLVWSWTAGSPFRPLLHEVALVAMRAGTSKDVANAAANAADSTLGLLVPALLLAFVVFRLRPRALGLVPRDLGLGTSFVAFGIALAAASAVLGLGTTDIFGAGPATGAALFAAGLLINAVPEEFVFRGALQTRARSLFGDPQHVIVLSSILFVVSHVPAYLAQHPGGVWWLVTAGAVVSPGAQPTGLLWGYLFHRTGSIWPGVLVHASFTTLGIVFI